MTLKVVQELYGNQTAALFTGALSRLLTTYLQLHGFSCGMDDLLLQVAPLCSSSALAEPLDARKHAGPGHPFRLALTSPHDLHNLALFWASLESNASGHYSLLYVRSGVSHVALQAHKHAVSTLPPHTLSSAISKLGQALRQEANLHQLA